MAMSGGLNWGVVYEVIAPLGSEFQALFIVFITFSFIALLNVATAVFVESTMRRSNNDREMMVQMELNDKKRFLDTMQDIFGELDEDGEGGITKDELQRRLTDPNIGAYFTRLGVDVDQFEKLFNLLDSDGSGSIDLDEFTFGCLRLRGEARCMDLE